MPVINDSKQTPSWPGPVLLVLGLAFFYCFFSLRYLTVDYFNYGIPYITNYIGHSFSETRDLFGYYPPLYYVFLYLCHWLLGKDLVRFLLMNSLFIAGGALYLYAIARRLGDRLVPSLPVVLLAMLPGVATASTSLTIEHPLLVLIPGLAYHLLASNGLRNTGHSILAGLMLGLGMLTKWTFPSYVGVFVGIFLVWSIAFVLKENIGSRKSAVIKNLILFLGIGLLICLPWYVLKMNWHTLFETSLNDPNYPTYSYARNLRTYLDFFFLLLGRTPCLIMAILAGWALVFGSRRRVLLAAIIGFVLTPVALFAVPVHLEMRYLYPLLPALAFIGYFSAISIRPRILRPLAALTLVLVLCTSFFHFVRNQPERADDPGANILGMHSEAGLFVKALSGMIESSNYKQVLQVATHPIWRTVHIRCDYMLYYTASYNVLDRIQMLCYEGFFYADFRKSLVEGRFDIILIDFEPGESGMERNRDRVERLALFMGPRGYVDQIGGGTAETFTVEDVLSDLEFIRENYAVVLKLPFSDGSTSTVWAKKSLAGTLYPAPKTDS